MLAGLGFTFDANELSSLEVECYTVIANKFSDLEQKEMKKKR